MAVITQYHRSIALLIGLNSYKDPHFAPLAKAEEDMRRLEKALRAAPYHFEVYTLYGPQATHQNILTVLQKLIDLTGPDDRVLIAYAGHGFTVQDRFDGETGYIATYDDHANNFLSSMKMSDLTDFRRFSQARHIGFIFDSCFGGQALGLNKASPAHTSPTLRTAFQVISAGTADQTVSDYFSLTSHLVDILQNPHGTLTMTHLGHALQQTIYQLSGGMQKPLYGHIRGSEGGDLMFYQTDTLERLGPLPPRLKEGLRHNDPQMRYFAIAELEIMLNQPATVLTARAALEEIAANDADRDVRYRALEAIKRFYAANSQRDGGYATPHTELEPVDDTRVSSTQRLRRAQARLVFYPAEGPERVIPLDKPHIIIGRSGSSDIVLNDVSVSRRHAVVITQGNQHYLEDLNSTNGTFIDDINITGQQLRLYHGATIRIAGCILVYMGAAGTGRLPSG